MIGILDYDAGNLKSLSNALTKNNKKSTNPSLSSSLKNTKKPLAAMQVSQSSRKATQKKETKALTNMIHASPIKVANMIHASPIKVAKTEVHTMHSDSTLIVCLVQTQGLSVVIWNEQ